MPAKSVHREEQIKLIMECRQSGLTDSEWCRQHNINIGTFYNWVKRLKRIDGIAFPRKNKADITYTNKQEVVKLDVLQISDPISGVNDQYNNSISFNGNYVTTPSQTMRVTLSYGSVEIPNGTDPTLLEATLRILGGIYAG